MTKQDTNALIVLALLAYATLLFLPLSKSVAFEMEAKILIGAYLVGLVSFLIARYFNAQKVAEILVLFAWIFQIPLIVALVILVPSSSDY